MTNKTAPRISLGIAILMMALGARSVRASTIYTYTGNDYQLAPPPFTTSDFITASFPFASPLAPDLPLTDDTSLVASSWTISDGVYTDTPLNSTLTELLIATNAAGSPLYWEFIVGGVDTTIGSFYNPQFPGGSADYDHAVENGTSKCACNLDAHGTWATSASGVPEAGTNELISLGVAILVIAGWRNAPKRVATKTIR